MEKALLISIHPEWAEKILNGEKTIEIRTWIPKDYVGWVYLYCTKAKPYLTWDYNMNHLGSMWKVFELHEKKDNDLEYFNGKVAFRFWYEKVEKVIMRPIWGEWEAYGEETDFINLSKKSCLTQKEIMRYLKGKVGYAWHIGKLEVFDKPKELSEFYHYKKKLIDCGMDCPPYIDEVKVPLTKAPQKMVWVVE